MKPNHAQVPQLRKWLSAGQPFEVEQGALL
jgi:hypothetical protein